MAFQLQGRDVVHFGIILIYHMQDDILIGFVGLVAVVFPVAAFHVYLHMARPQLVADLDFCLQEIRARVGITVASGHYFNLLAFRSLQGFVCQSVLPKVV